MIMAMPCAIQPLSELVCLIKLKDFLPNRLQKILPRTVPVFCVIYNPHGTPAYMAGLFMRSSTPFYLFSLDPIKYYKHPRYSETLTPNRMCISTMKAIVN